MKPPFRAEHIGSLLRPPRLVEGAEVTGVTGRAVKVRRTDKNVLQVALTDALYVRTHTDGAARPCLCCAQGYEMPSLQSVADMEDVVVVCAKPFSAYTGLDVLLACIHADGRFEVLSAAWEQALGYRCEELDGSSLFDLLPFDEASVRALLRRITDPTEPEPLVFDVRCKGAGPLRMRWHRRFDQYADAVFIAGLREAANQGSESDRSKASDSALNAA